MTKVLSLAILVSVAIGSQGCAPVLSPSPCTDDDDLTARTVVFGADGVPAYAGQALMASSCAGDGSFCHTPNPSTAFGAPAGINFDVGVACGDATTPCNDALTELRSAQRDVVDWRRHIIHEIENETMPPGEAGESVLSGALTYRMGPNPTDPELPGVGTTEGRALLEHWLACGAPVVERSIAPGILMTGDNCTCVGESCDLVPAAQVGDCYVRAEITIEPMWSSIFNGVIAAGCAGSSCHDAGANAPDLSSWQASYDALVDQPASTGCNDSMPTSYVEPGQPMDSVLVRILIGGSACSIGQMPLGRPALDSSITDVIADWVTAGAMLD